MRAHAQRFGAEVLPGRSVANICTMNSFKVVNTESGDEYCADSVLVATGSRYRRQTVPGEDDLIGAGIHFFTICDGVFYKGEEMLVIGGDDSGSLEGLFLTKFTTEITILEVGERPRAQPDTPGTG